MPIPLWLYLLRLAIGVALFAAIPPALRTLAHIPTAWRQYRDSRERGK